MKESWRKPWCFGLVTSVNPALITTYLARDRPTPTLSANCRGPKKRLHYGCVTFRPENSLSCARMTERNGSGRSLTLQGWKPRIFFQREKKDFKRFRLCKVTALAEFLLGWRYDSLFYLNFPVSKLAALRRSLETRLSAQLCCIFPNFP